MKSLLIIVLAVGLGWSLYRLGDVEREHYAMLTGMCKQDSFGIYDFECLDTAEPRTSWLWDIVYGLFP
ncbi:MAG: hypothetical protein DI528_05530 [Shinella sp.]|nr:MAG: hypothetical protein DI528_05530 [Shinella sp.]